MQSDNTICRQVNCTDKLSQLTYNVHTFICQSHTKEKQKAKKNTQTETKIYGKKLWPLKIIRMHCTGVPNVTPMNSVFLSTIGEFNYQQNLCQSLVAAEKASSSNCFCKVPNKGVYDTTFVSELRITSLLLLLLIATTTMIQLMTKIVMTSVCICTNYWQTTQVLWRWYKRPQAGERKCHAGYKLRGHSWSQSLSRQHALVQSQGWAE